MDLSVSGTPNFLKHPIHRFSKYKSYDKSAGKSLGLVYSRHEPSAAETLDRLELARSLRIIYGETLARALVSVFNFINPNIKYGNKITKPAFNSWDRLPNQIKPAMYAGSALENNIPLTHALTIHIPYQLVDLELLRSIAEGKSKLVGPATIIGSHFLSKTVSNVYRRHNFLDEFNFIYVIEAKPLFDEDEETGEIDKENERSKLVSFHSTIALNVPNAIEKQVRKSIASWSNDIVEKIHIPNSNTGALLRRIQNRLNFKKGEDATGRSGLLGWIDYGCKDIKNNYSYSKDYKDSGSSNPLPMGKYAGASRNVITEAKVLYEELRAMNKAHPYISVQNAKLSKLHSNIGSTDVKVSDAVASVKRIAGSRYEHDLSVLLDDWTPQNILRQLEIALSKFPKHTSSMSIK